MSTSYRVATAPKFAGFRVWDCARCHHEELAKPIFLTGPDGLVSVGTGCALVLLGRKDSAKARKALVTEVHATEVAAELRRERSDRAYRILTIAAMTGTHPTEVMGQIGEGPGMLVNFHHAKREGRATSVKAYLAEVERTGEI